MKTECTVEKIKLAVSQTERITAKNPTLPVLNSILLTAKDKTLKLRSTNLSVGLEVVVPAKIEKEGTCAIHGGTLFAVFSNLNPNERVTIEENGGNIVIKTKKTRVVLKGNPTEDFPSIPTIEGEEFEVETKKFIGGIKSVHYSASPSDIKPEISSVFVYKDGDDMVFVSTDSFRLAEKRVRAKAPDELTGTIIPFRNVSEILRVFSDTTEKLKICFNKNQISLSSENIYFTSRIIDGVFPDYRQIIPKNPKTEAVILKEELINALRLSNIFSDKFNQVTLSIKPKEKFFELSSHNSEVGENKTTVDATLEGTPVSVSFNYKYFIDCFQSVTTDSLAIKITDSSHPILMSPIGDPSFTYLIMPMSKQ